MKDLTDEIGLEEIFRKIKKSWTYLNPRYDGSFEVSESEGCVCIFIQSRWKKNYEKSKGRIIKDIFNAKDVHFIDTKLKVNQMTFFGR